METDQCEVLERELAADHTVKYAQRVSHYEEWPVYGIEFSPKTLLLGSEVTEHNGFALTARHHHGGWIERWQLPDKKSLQSVWEYANDQSFRFEVRKVHQLSEGTEEPECGMTDKQREALICAYNKGYFEKPSEITLEGVAEALDISTTAASGRIKRGMKNIIESSISGIK